MHTFMHACMYTHACVYVCVYVYTIAIHVIVFGCVSVMMCVCVFDPGAKLKDFQPRARKASVPHRLFASSSVMYC
jgi:hypothetical protein